MKWLIFAGLNIVSLSLYSLISKIIAPKVTTPLRVLIINFSIFAVALVWFAYSLKTGAKFNYDKSGLIFSALAGLLAGSAVVFFQLMFSNGASLSIGNLVARVGVIILGAILGVIILKEPLTLRILAGFSLAVLGIYLVLMK